MRSGGFQVAHLQGFSSPLASGFEESCRSERLGARSKQSVCVHSVGVGAQACMCVHMQHVQTHVHACHVHKCIVSVFLPMHVPTCTQEHG